MSRRPWRFVPAAVVLLGILTLTLAPQPAVDGAPRFDLGLSGARNVADAIANVLLFLPFGAAAMFALGRWRPALLAGATLSLFIESTQLLVPGRFTSPADLLFNTLGTALGVLLASRPELWLRPPPGRRAVLAWTAWSAAVALLVGGTRLFEPAFPDRPLWGQWTPERGAHGAYSGTVIGARVGPLPVQGGGPIADPAGVRERLLAGDTLVVAFRTGSTTAERFPVLNVASPDDVLMSVSVQGSDLLVAYRMRAAGLGLDQPYLRFPDALRGVTPGDEVEVRVWRQDRLFCIARGDARLCGLGFSPADTWALLLFPLPAVLAAAMPFAWLLALLGPPGFWAPDGRHLAGMVALLAVVLIATSAGGVATRPPAPIEGALAAAALLLGFAGRRAAAAESTATLPAAPAPGRMPADPALPVSPARPGGAPRRRSS